MKAEKRHDATRSLGDRGAQGDDETMLRTMPRAGADPIPRGDRMLGLNPTLGATRSPAGIAPDVRHQGTLNTHIFMKYTHSTFTLAYRGIVLVHLLTRAPTACQARRAGGPRRPRQQHAPQGRALAF